MLAAWFLRRCYVEGERHNFNGWHPFRAYRYRGVVHYFSPFAPPWTRRPGVIPLTQAAQGLTHDAECLFLHEAWWHYKHGAGHAPDGIGALNGRTRAKTTTQGQIEVAWMDLSNAFEGVRIQ